MARTRTQKRVQDLEEITADLVSAIENANYAYITWSGNLTRHMRSAIQKFNDWRTNATNS